MVTLSDSSLTQVKRSRRTQSPAIFDGVVFTRDPKRLQFYHLRKCPDSEPIKMLLGYIGHPYDEISIKKSRWPLIREEIISKRVPALRIQHRDGSLEWMTESKAILRCLGAQYKLLGRDQMEMYYCDRMIGKIMEADALLKEFHNKKKHHDFDRAAFKDKLFEDIEAILKSIDKMLNEAPGEYAAADVMTIADFYLLNFIDFLRANKPEFLTPYPFLEQWRKYLLQHEQQIAKYTASRCWDII